MSRAHVVGSPVTYGALTITEEERRAAIAASLSRTEPYDLTDSVITHVQRTAERTPWRTAIESPGRAVSYGELATESGRAAAALFERGVREGQVVAVGGERCAEVVTAFLGLELLGAVYLPVDPGWPVARIESVLRDSGASWLLTTGDEHDWGRLREGAREAGCGTGPLTLADVPSARLRSHPPAQDEIRYVLYTSGTTGRPKGALVEHQGMMNHLWAKVADLAITERDKLAQTAPLGFDISIWQMLAPLLAGGTVQVFTDDEARDGTKLLDSVVSRGTTIVEVVPTLIRFVLDAWDSGLDEIPVTSLRWMIATGEELVPALAQRWLATFPGIGMLNAYGPTECSDDVTHARLTSPITAQRHLPIGAPIGNVTLYVLRKDFDAWRACPRGEAGELFVAGVSVGRGYLGDARRTADAFYQDPFTGKGRLYRTGDAVRVLPSGELEYLGRVDRQVKLGGVRLELSEIESVLAAHPNVAGCAVTVYTPSSEGALVARETARHGATTAVPRLVGYVVLRESASGVGELSDHLAARLPTPMVPRTLIEVSDLPLTRNGKVDYAALPAPPRRERPAELAFEPPAGPAEQHVAAAVSEVLGLDAVGRQDRFMELGGDSLLAMRLLSRLRADGLAGSLRDILIDGSPAALAALAGSVRAIDTPTQAARPQPDATETRVRTRKLNPQQAGVYFHWRLDPDSPYYSYQGTLEMVGPFDLARFSWAWTVLLAENPVLLARFTDEDDEPAHTYPHWEVPLPPIEDLTGHPDAERRLRYRDQARAEAVLPFDLHGAPALRARLFRLGAEEHRMLVTMHEILLDGWGATVLFQRLAQLYGLAAEEGSGPDPHRAQRYDRYLDWQATFLGTPHVEEAGCYWRRQLDGELPVLDVAQRIRPAQPSYRGRLVESVVRGEFAASLRATAVRTGGTPFVFLLAAYALALTYYGDADEVVIGAPVAGRDRPEQVDVPAFMLSMLPLRIRVCPDTTVEQFVAEVRDVVFDGYAAMDYPLGWTVRELTAAARSGSATPLFQTMLNMPAYPDQDTTVDGLNFRFVELDTGYTKYDCALYAQQHGSAELLLQFAYQEQLMDEPAAARMLESILIALRALVGDPGRKLSEVDLLPGVVPETAVSPLTVESVY